MAKKFVETEKQKKVAIQNVDDQTERLRFEEVNKKAFDALFDNTYQTEKIEETFDEIETECLGIEEEQTTFNQKIEVPQKAVESQSSFKQVVCSQEQNEPSIEIKEKISIEKVKRVKPETKVSKLWLITGGVCVALFLVLFSYNMISINTLAKQVAKSEYQIHEKEQTLDEANKNFQQQIDEYVNSHQMQPSSEKTAKSVDLSAQTTEKQFEVKTSFWDKICNFFANLFGR